MGVRLVYFNKPLNNTDGNKTIFEDHNDLINRDIRDQHPIFAISGLNEVLSTIETLLTQQTSNHEYLEGILYELKTGLTSADILINAIKQRVDELLTWKSSVSQPSPPPILNTADTNSIDITYDDNTRNFKADVKVVASNTLYSIRNRSNAVNKLYITKNGLYVPNDIMLNSKTITWESEMSTDTHAVLVTNGYYFSHKSTSTEDVYETSRLEKWIYDSLNNKLLYSYPDESVYDLYQGFISQSLYTDFIVTAKYNFKSSDAISGWNSYYDRNNPANKFSLGITLYKHNPVTNKFETIDVVSTIGFNGTYSYCQVGAALVTNYYTNGTGSSSISYTSQCQPGDGAVITYEVTVQNKIIKTIKFIYGSVATYTMSPNYNIGDAVHVGFGVRNLKRVELVDFKIVVPEGGAIQEEQGIITVENFRPNVNISSSANNALKINNDGLFVPGLSIESDNALVKNTDGGYFVQDTKISDKFGNGIEWDGIKTLYCRTSKDYKEVTQESHGFSIGNFIYYSEEYNKYEKAIATDDYSANVIGMVTRIIDTDTFEFMWSGFFETELFNSTNAYHQGMPLYLSDISAGSVTQIQPDISKTVGYPVENTGIIISIERGIQYNNEPKLGEIKQSTLTYNVRTDGFIRMTENIQYKLSLVGSVVNAVSEQFKNNYMIVNEFNQTLMFKNVDDLKIIMEIPEGIELFIKAF